MPTQTPPNYRVAPGMDRCDRCFFRADDGMSCDKYSFGRDDGYTPSGLCDTFAERSMGQRFEEDEKNPQSEAAAQTATRTDPVSADPPEPPRTDPPETPATETLEADSEDVARFRQTIVGVEIFKAGHWNGRTYTKKDLDDIVKAAQTMGYKPPVKLGHTEEPGAPAYGYVVNIRREGDTLLADFEDVPEELVEQIREKRYDQVSAEIYFDLKRGDKTYRRALRAVAVLGAHPPGVADLKPLSEALASLSSEARFEIVSTTSQESDPMAVKDTGTVPAGEQQTQNNPNPNPGQGQGETVSLTEAQQQIVALQQQLAEANRRAEQTSTAQLTIQRLTETVAQLQRNQAEAHESARQGRIAALVAQVKRPTWRGHIQALAELGTRKDEPGAEPEKVNFQAAGADEASPTDALGVLEDLVRLMNADVAHLFTEQVKRGDVPRVLSTGVDDPGSVLFAKVADYCRQHPDVDPDRARQIVLSDPRNSDLVKGWNRNIGQAN